MGEVFERADAGYKKPAESGMKFQRTSKGNRPVLVSLT